MFSETFCVYIDKDEHTDEDKISDGGLDYEDDGEDILMDEVLEFDKGDVGLFVNRANNFLDDPKSAEFIGMDAAKSDGTKNC